MKPCKTQHKPQPCRDRTPCNGCEAGTYRKTSWFSEEQGTQEILYPYRGVGEALRLPKEYESFPEGSPVEHVYRETIRAINEPLRTLAAAGIRLIVEAICYDCKVTRGNVTCDDGKVRRRTNLEGKINGLLEIDRITKAQVKALHELRFLGNDAAHQFDKPTPATLRTAIDLVEQIMTQIYDQPEQTKLLAARKRPPKR